MKKVNSQTKLPEPYCSINLLPFDPHGWFANEKEIEAILKAKPCQTVIEVGSWLGASTRFIAQNLPKGAKLYAIDTWLGSFDEEVHMLDIRLPILYQLFLSNVVHAGLSNIIIPVRMNSIEASKALNVKADLIYLDAAHDTKSVYEDILAWYPHLNEGGVLCGDDWAWSTVREGVLQAAEELKKEVVNHMTFWCFA